MDSTEACSLDAVIAYLPEGEGLSEWHAVALLRQALQGLAHLHGKSIVHGSVDTSRIVIEAKSGTVKLSGVGALERVPMYMAPELIRTGHALPASDVWSVGCLLIEILKGSQPWEGTAGETSFLPRVVSGEHPPVPSGCSMSAFSFLASCFSYLPEDRPTVDELLEHPFLARIDLAADVADAFDDMPLLYKKTYISSARPSSVPKLPSTDHIFFESPSQTSRLLSFAARGARRARPLSGCGVNSPLPKRKRVRVVKMICS